MEKRNYKQVNRTENGARRPSFGGERKSYSQKPKAPAENLAIGLRAVEETMRAGTTIERLLVQKDGSSSVRDIAVEAAARKIPVQWVPIEKLNRINAGNHQGVIAFISEVEYVELEALVARAFAVSGGSQKAPLLFLLDRVTDVRNLGAIARSMECMGANGLIVPNKGSAQINADAMKTSAGALNYLPVCRVENLIDAILLLQSEGFEVYGCSEKASSSLFEMDFTKPCVVIFGNEEEGISPSLLKRSNGNFLIPMLGKVESLNVSVAAGMVLLEAFRQKM